VTIRLRFWLFIMDAIALCGGLGSRPYTYAVRMASDATDWGAP
jgi:hypothetical protein